MRAGASAIRDSMRRDEKDSEGRHSERGRDRGDMNGELSSRNLSLLNQSHSRGGVGEFRSSPSKSSLHSTPREGGGRREDRSETGVSSMSTKSVADSVISRSIARKGRF
jgi:hypothetical protein